MFFTLNQNNKRGLYIYLGMLMLVVFLVMSWFNSTTGKKGSEYNRIIADFLSDQVGEYQLDFNTRTLTYTLWADMPETPADTPDEGQSQSQTPALPSLFPTTPAVNQKVKTYQVPDNSLFINDVHDHVVEYNAQHPDKPVKQVYIGYSDPSFLTTWLPVLLPIVAMVALWWMIMRQTRGTGNPMAFAKARAKLPSDGNQVLFADVAGADEEKAELQEIVEFLKNPEKFNALGARIPKGVLLMGPDRRAHV